MTPFRTSEEKYRAAMKHLVFTVVLILAITTIFAVLINVGLSSAWHKNYVVGPRFAGTVEYSMESCNESVYGDDGHVGIGAWAVVIKITNNGNDLYPISHGWQVVMDDGNIYEELGCEFEEYDDLQPGHSTTYTVYFVRNLRTLPMYIRSDDITNVRTIRLSTSVQPIPVINWYFCVSIYLMGLLISKIIYSVEKIDLMQYYHVEYVEGSDN